MLEAYLVKGEPAGFLKNFMSSSSIRHTWQTKYSIKIALEANSSVEILQYTVFDGDGKELSV
jgi:hypothetical protein